MFGPRNPQRVAEKQLNQAKLDLLEVSGALENYEAQKAALVARISRLSAIVNDPVAVPEASARMPLSDVPARTFKKEAGLAAA
jgi:hypothetical protein